VAVARRILNSLKDLNVLVIGDAIIDEYFFALPKGRAVKDPILSTEYQGREEYAGGTLNVANHVAEFVKKVQLVTLFGDKKETLFNPAKFLNKKIELQVFTKKGAYTTWKRRFVSPYRNEKLFKIEYITDQPIGLDLSNQINNYLIQEVPKYDAVIVCDFGHGFLNQALRDTILRNAKFVAVNSQSNSSNMGYNYITHYFEDRAHLPHFISVTHEELRLALDARFEPIDVLIKFAYKKYGLKDIMITLGKKGSVYLHDGKTFEENAFINNPVDTMGAGDALYSITSLLVAKGVSPALIPFFGNTAGGLASQTVGNKPITPVRLLEFISEVK
jgi:bifunctional ADP-heptose synthase (sugar kinase/adenylyltransferase)